MPRGRPSERSGIMRRPVLAANWKMNLGRPQGALEFVRGIRYALNAIETVDRVVCPPFTAVAAIAEALAATSIAVGAQNMHFAEQGERWVSPWEPIWAIGTGRAATPTDANRVIALSIRTPISDRFGEDVAQAVRVQYGGSVTVDNIAEFMVMPEIDGALVGGASLKPDYAVVGGRAARGFGERKTAVVFWGARGEGPPKRAAPSRPAPHPLQNGGGAGL